MFTPVRTQGACYTSGGMGPGLSAWWKLLHLRSMLSQSMRCPQNCHACSWHRSTEWARFFSVTTPDRPLHNLTLQKLNGFGYKVLPHLPSSPDLLPTNHRSKYRSSFVQGKGFHGQQEQKMLSKSLLNPKAWIFILQEQTGLILVGKNVLIVVVPTLIKMCWSLVIMI